MKNPKITFIIDKKLDIENHLIGMYSYKDKLHTRTNKNERYEKLLKLTPKQRIDFIQKEISDFYSNKNKAKLEEIRNEIQNHWNKIEKEFFKKIEKTFNKPFPFNSIKGILSTANRFGYNYKNKWFATNIYSNKFSATDIAMHELFHFVFHFYFEKECEKYELTWKQIWDIKEALTVLLNSEFLDLRLALDKGYPEHQKIRDFILKEWKKNKDFDIVLNNTCKFVKKNC
ncbi:MAG: hypothetical protein PHH35_01715 [Candidatus Pacebacteria bacterium]|nr:hypothetical protein [Candidatus Paceibacterota bacterium]